MLRRRFLQVLLVGLLGLWPGIAAAVQPDEILPDPALEQRARALSGELRCLVCQNQSIDDSNAPLARDLRVLVRERLKAGDSDAAVRDFVVDRYGAFVLLRPPVQPSTWLLWATPLLLLGATALVIGARLRSAPEKTATATTPLSADERNRLDRLLERDG